MMVETKEIAEALVADCARSLRPLVAKTRGLQFRGRCGFAVPRRGRLREDLVECVAGEDAFAPHLELVGMGAIESLGDIAG